MSEGAAIAGLTASTVTLWTRGGGQVAQVVAREDLDGNWHLKTLGDGVQSNALLQLPHCPTNCKHRI